MNKKEEVHPYEYDGPRNPYTGIADLCRLSERTIRSAFQRKPVTLQTALKIAKAIGIDIIHFRIKVDRRGQKKNLRQSPQ